MTDWQRPLFVNYIYSHLLLVVSISWFIWKHSKVCSQFCLSDHQPKKHASQNSEIPVRKLCNSSTHILCRIEQRQEN